MTVADFFSMIIKFCSRLFYDLFHPSRTELFSLVSRLFLFWIGMVIVWKIIKTIKIKIQQLYYKIQKKKWEQIKRIEEEKRRREYAKKEPLRKEQERIATEKMEWEYKRRQEEQLQQIKNVLDL